MKKYLILLALTVTQMANAMPVQNVSLGERTEFVVTEQGLGLIVDLGFLLPGWYRLNEKGLSGLVKESNRNLSDADRSSVLEFYVGPGAQEGQRFAHLTTPRAARFEIILLSREAQLSAYPKEKFDASQMSNYGSPIDAKEFAGYPDCDFVRGISPAGERHFVEYTLESVHSSAVPAGVQERIQRER